MIKNPSYRSKDKNIPNITKEVIIATADEPTKTGKIYSLDELKECTEGDSRLYLIGKDLWLDPVKVPKPSKSATERIYNLTDPGCKCWVRFYSKGEWEIVVWWIRDYGLPSEKEFEYRKVLTPLELTRLLYMADYSSFLDRFLDEIMKGYKAYK